MVKSWVVPPAQGASIKADLAPTSAWPTRLSGGHGQQGSRYAPKLHLPHRPRASLASHSEKSAFGEFKSKCRVQESLVQAFCVPSVRILPLSAVSHLLGCAELGEQLQIKPSGCGFHLATAFPWPGNKPGAALQFVEVPSTQLCPGWSPGTCRKMEMTLAEQWLVHC